MFEAMFILGLLIAAAIAGQLIGRACAWTCDKIDARIEKLEDKRLFSGCHPEIEPLCDASIVVERPTIEFSHDVAVAQAEGKG